MFGQSIRCSECVHTSVKQELLKFPQLQVLDLQGNNLTKINPFQKLARLSQLRKLSLQGNYELMKIGHHRHCLIAILPQLSSLDATRITAQERGDAITYYSIFKNAKTS